MSPLADLRQRYLTGATNPFAELNTALARSNSNASRNTYITQSPDFSRAEAAALSPTNIEKQPLYGVPVSLKDCFDLTGFPTSCGSAFYRDHNSIAPTDSTVAARLRAAGALITGKTHLHQLAYGITGQNPDFADCLQPADSTLLTGGSSSGAAASVQEGSALAAIGTDTGGSIRIPAMLCGLSGYRSSISLNTPNLWLGGHHLAPSFDTLGWLYRSLADGPILAHALLNLPLAPVPTTLSGLRIGTPSPAFLHDCEPHVLHTLRQTLSALTQHSATVTSFDATFWDEALSIFVPIQASESAAIHRGHFQHFDPAIAARLAYGATLTPADLEPLRQRHADFNHRTYALFDQFDYLILPAAPMSTLPAADDHTHTRTRILRYTTPLSLTGLPIVTLPGGLQLIAPLNHDAQLLALSTHLNSSLAPH